MRVPRIVKIVLLLLVLWQAVSLFGKNSGTSPATGLSIVAVTTKGSEVTIVLKSDRPVDPDTLSVYTDGECELVQAEFLKEQNVTRAVYECPEGEFVKVVGEGVSLTKRLG